LITDPKLPRNFVIVDLEFADYTVAVRTTGSLPCPLQIGATHVAFDGAFEVVSEYSTNIIPHDASHVTEAIQNFLELDLQDLQRTGKPLSEVLTEFKAFQGHKPLWSFTAIDALILHYWYQKCSMTSLHLANHTDVASYAQALGNYPTAPSLNALCKSLGIEVRPGHHALTHVKLVVRVLEVLLGLDTIEEKPSSDSFKLFEF
jgi:DNA polymerase III alpha subunit (gram-positive type)